MNMPNKIERWAKHRPFMMAFVIMLIMVIPGFISVAAALGNAQRAIDRAEEVAAEARYVADRNRQVVSCITHWVKKNTDALQDRDSINKTARDAQLEMWMEVYDFLNTAPPFADRQPMLNSIKRFTDILERLVRNGSIDPYPNIKTCLEKPLPTVYVLTSALHPGHPCWGRTVTIRGTKADDILRGTDGTDVIIGLKGNDLIFAGDGDDRICGDRGDDTINGGGGFDRGRGGRGTDFCIQTEREKGC